MITEILTLLRDLGIFSVAMYFIQLLISKSADRKFESYKTELEHKTREFQTTLDSKLELYRAQLILQNYKSTKVYEKQLDIIIVLHKKLMRLKHTMQEMTALIKATRDNVSKEKDEEDRIKNTADSYIDFINFYTENIIFIPKQAADRIDELKADYFKNHLEYVFMRGFSSTNENLYEKYTEIAEKFKMKIEPAMAQLIIDFRELIGVDEVSELSLKEK